MEGRTTPMPACREPAWSFEPGRKVVSCPCGWAVSVEFLDVAGSVFRVALGHRLPRVVLA